MSDILFVIFLFVCSCFYQKGVFSSHLNPLSIVAENSPSNTPCMLQKPKVALMRKPESSLSRTSSTPSLLSVIVDKARSSNQNFSLQLFPVWEMKQGFNLILNWLEMMLKSLEMIKTCFYNPEMFFFKYSLSNLLIHNVSYFKLLYWELK